MSKVKKNRNDTYLKLGLFFLVASIPFAIAGDLDKANVIALAGLLCAYKY